MKDVIRLARKSDAPVIAEFNRAMALETEGRQLTARQLATGVARLFDRPDYGFYVVAEVAGELAGCLMVTYEWSDWRNGVYWWVQSVYVRPEYRRRGIYRLLYRYLKQRAARAGNVCGFRLYVHKDNVVAQRTYRTLGMRDAHYRVFEEMTR
jgi:ribosomal protein S18 acetylase RimI-like enzyme